MFRYCVILCVFSSGIILASSQETLATRVSNTSENGRPNSRKPTADESLEHNLWLISRDDPIPARLNERWSVGDVMPTGQIINLRAEDYSNVFARDSVENPLQSPAALISESPVIRYDRTLTAANRRESSNGRELGIENSEALLLQLPIEITEGLWERPQPRNFQFSENGRQNGVAENVNIRFDEATSIGQPEEIPSVFVPIRELTSRLPSSDFTPQADSNIASRQYYEVPVQHFTAAVDYANGINISSSHVSLPESDARESWFFREYGEHSTGFEDAGEKEIYENYGHGASQRDRDVHEVGSILTSEDIELLERLGILSSLIIEPLLPENKSDNFTSKENSEREYESEPALIDNGGQIPSVNSSTENTANHSEVVLFDLPKFTTAEYHTNVPENAGIDKEGIRISPYRVVEIGNSLALNTDTNETLSDRNSTDLSDRQLLEILQLLNLNTGDFFNLSLPATLAQQTKLVDHSTTEEAGKNDTDDKASRNIVSGEVSTNSNVQSIATNQTLNDSRQNIKDRNEYVAQGNATASIPSVRDGRIQPRLLEKLTPKENEIMERLFHNALPISASKIEMLKKLQIQPQPYFFGFRQDDGNGTLQHRNETSDSKGVVKGSYGYRDAMGVYRNVSYIADNNGFHAVVKTNEPGMVSHNTADAVFMSETPPLAALLKMMAYKRPKLPINVTEV